MILITSSPHKAITVWLKEAIVALSQNDLDGFLDKFDYSALKKVIFICYYDVEMKKENHL